MDAITYTVLTERFYESIGDDEYTPGEHFNIDAQPHWQKRDEIENSPVGEAILYLRRLGVRFEASGDGVTASEPDGSHVIDYATAERQRVTVVIDHEASADWAIAAVVAGVDQL